MDQETVTTFIEEILNNSDILEKSIAKYSFEHGDKAEEIPQEKAKVDMAKTVIGPLDNTKRLVKKQDFVKDVTENVAQIIIKNDDFVKFIEKATNMKVEKKTKKIEMEIKLAKMKLKVWNSILGAIGLYFMVYPTMKMKTQTS